MRSLTARPCSCALAAWFRPPQCTSLCPRALGFSSPLAHSETLTHPVLAQHLFLVPAPQHREHAPVGSLRQPSRATMPLRLPLFLDSLCVLDAGILASDSLCPLSRRFTTPTDHLHHLLSRSGLAPRLNSLHALSDFLVVRTNACCPPLSLALSERITLQFSTRLSCALPWPGSCSHALQLGFAHCNPPRSPLVVRRPQRSLVATTPPTSTRIVQRLTLFLCVPARDHSHLAGQASLADSLYHRATSTFALTPLPAT